MKQQKNTITILGCGWLGKIVGEALVQSGHSVHASYHNQKTGDEIDALGMNAFYCDFDTSPSIPNEILEQTDHFLILAPPSIATESKAYFEVLNDVTSSIQGHSNVIFSSSIGIYPKETGNYDESFHFNENEPNNKLWLAENALRSRFESRLTVLRLGGLLGPKRHPIFSMQGRSISHDGSAPINLIHSGDILAAINLILAQNHFGSTYNLVYPDDEQKKIYYENAALSLGLDPPKFGTGNSPYRSVNGNLITKNLDFQYAYSPNNFKEFALPTA